MLHVKPTCKYMFIIETGGIALIVDHELKDLPEGNFPAKPFFGVDPVIVDPHLVIIVE